MSTQPRPVRRRRPLPLRVWRNPLARKIDRVEAAVVLVLAAIWLATLPIIATVGSVRLADATAQSDQQRGSSTAVQAIVEQDVQVPVGAADAPALWVAAPVRWVGPDGRPVTGVVDVPGIASAGDHITVWLDRAGRVEPAPTSTAALAGLTMMVGVGSWILIGLLMLAIGWTVRLRLDHRRLHAWEREWAQVEPGRHPF